MNADHRPLRILLLGGTSEARALADELARLPSVTATLSLAGRTASPHIGPLQTRVGGYGGVDGLADYLKRETIDLVLDATHPFAARISDNAVAACRKSGAMLLALERPAWTREPGDNWREHDTVEAMIQALPAEPRIIFSALGRQSMTALGAAPQHTYVIRVVDPIAPPAELRNSKIILGRGPFCAEDDARLFAEHRIDLVLAKNAGGDATYAKIAAAQQLGLTVHIVRRPTISDRPTVGTVQDAMSWLSAHQASRSKRGV